MQIYTRHPGCQQNIHEQLLFWFRSESKDNLKWDFLELSDVSYGNFCIFGDGIFVRILIVELILHFLDRLDDRSVFNFGLLDNLAAFTRQPSQEQPIGANYRRCGTDV